MKTVMTEEQLEALRDWVKSEIVYAIAEYNNPHTYCQEEKTVADKAFNQVQTCFGDGL